MHASHVSNTRKSNAANEETNGNNQSHDPDQSTYLPHGNLKEAADRIDEGSKDGYVSNVEAGLEGNVPHDALPDSTSIRSDRGGQVGSEKGTTVREDLSVIGSIATGGSASSRGAVQDATAIGFLEREGKHEGGIQHCGMR